jgi:hypothetical protein
MPVLLAVSGQGEYISCLLNGPNVTDLFLLSRRTEICCGAGLTVQIVEPSIRFAICAAEGVYELSPVPDLHATINACLAQNCGDNSYLESGAVSEAVVAMLLKLELSRIIASTKIIYECFTHSNFSVIRPTYDGLHAFKPFQQTPFICNGESFQQSPTWKDRCSSCAWALGNTYITTAGDSGGWTEDHHHRDHDWRWHWR